MLKASVKCAMDLTDSDICSETEPLRVLSHITWHSFSTEWHHCGCCPTSLWHSFSRYGTIAGVVPHHLTFIFNAMAPFRVLFHITLTFIYKVWHHCGCCPTSLWPSFSRYGTIAGVNLFYRFWYLQRNGTIAGVVPHHFDIHFQGQPFSCYASLQ